MIELWAWTRLAEALVNRRLSSWDDEDRPTSHADRRNALRRQCLMNEFQAAAMSAPVSQKIESLWRRVLGLVA